MFLGGGGRAWWPGEQSGVGMRLLGRFQAPTPRYTWPQFGKHGILSSLPAEQQAQIQGVHRRGLYLPWVKDTHVPLPQGGSSAPELSWIQVRPAGLPFQ